MYLYLLKYHYLCDSCINLDAQRNCISNPTIKPRLTANKIAQPIRIDDSSDPSPTSLDYFNLDGGISNTKNDTPPVFSPEEMSDYKLVRKKSGELVKPSLKSPLYYHKKRSLSLPSTPTYKQVHFGGSTDVRYFHKKDRPAAISASNSPKLSPADDDDGYDYSDDDDGYDNDSCDSDPESIDLNNKIFGS